MAEDGGGGTSSAGGSSILVDMNRIGLLLLALVAALGVACGDEYDDGASDGGSGSRDVICLAEPCPTPEPEATFGASPTPHTPAPTVAATATIAVAPTATSVPSTQAGTLVGTVHIGPTCPVVIEGEDCDDRPYEADLDVFDASGSLVLTARSDVNGDFSATLAAGAYRLVPRSYNVLPHASEQEFAIDAGRVTRVDVSYDSGIR
jgi:hypothetical protein